MKSSPAKKVSIKLIFVMICVSIISWLSYLFYLYLLPQVTVFNHSKEHGVTAVVTAPNSRMDFGMIEADSKNIIYHALAQSDGQYIVEITTIEGQVMSHSCGYVTSNQFHKRVTIDIDSNWLVTCHETW